MSEPDFLCPICSCGRGRRVFLYDNPPVGEIAFDFSSGRKYRREVLKCEGCGHYISRHDMDDGSLYSGEYVNATYSGEDGIRKAYERITGLDPSMSDNAGRVARVNEVAGNYFAALGEAGRSVLDVGSGLCVFLGRMKTHGWNCTALDPDARAVSHAVNTVGVNAVCGDFMNVELPAAYDLITFNKVLEHVADPVKMLERARAYLRPGGLIYVEVPDGECAEANGSGREEFFIDHLHVFSFASLALMATRAGFVTVLMERLREPSTKYTLRGFLIRN